MEAQNTKQKIQNYKLKSKRFWFFAVFFCFLFFVFGLANETKAANASLYLSPSTGSYTTGNTFLVQLKVNSGGVAINAVDGTLIFNPDKLEVISISKTDSVLSLWVQDPTFSNSLGTINFAGGKPSPGYSGAAGTVINITFRARTAGTATLTFAAGSVLADDGKGTNILSSLGSGSYTLSGKTVTPITPPAETGETYTPPASTSNTPSAPVVSSPTHANENQWYSNNDPEFTWKLPSDVTGVSLLLHEKPTANPGSESDGLLTSMKFDDVEDGIWYFHIKFRNGYGWGETTHRKILIDTQPPEPFQVVVDNDDDSTNPSPEFLFETTDSLSGIEYYEVILNKEVHGTSTAENIKNNPYKPLPLSPGKYTLEVKAYDKARNFSQASTDLTIISITPPEITKIPKNLDIGESLVVEGTGKPEMNIRVYIQKLEGETVYETTKTDLAGNFVFTYGKALAKGEYLVWARAEDERGALSEPTKNYSLDIGLPPFLKFGKIALDYLTIMATLILLIVGAIAVIFYISYRVSVWRKRVAKETKEVSQSVAGAFRALRDEVEEQISLLDKKPGLTKEEKAIRDKLQEALDISEKFIGKEIKDVEKELE